MTVSIGQIGTGIEAKMPPNSTNESIRASWTKADAKFAQMHDDGSFERYNTNGFALSRVKSETGIQFSSLAEVEASAKVQRQFADQYFGGDARKAADYIVAQSKKPEMAGKPFTLETLSAGLPKAGPAVVAQNPAAAAPPVVAPVSAAPVVPVTAATVAKGTDPSGVSNLMSILGINLDAQGRPDLNGDGVGGIQGLLKAVLSGFSNEDGGLNMNNGNSLIGGLFGKLFGAMPAEFTSIDPATGTKRDMTVGTGINPQAPDPGMIRSPVAGAVPGMGLTV